MDPENTIKYYIMQWKESDTIITLEPPYDKPHSKSSHIKKEYQKLNLSPSVHSIDDLILIGNTRIEYSNINTKMLWNIIDELKNIQNIIGMESLKKTLLIQIMYYLTDLNKDTDDYLHTILIGDPGCGKTTIAQYIGQLYKKMGILAKDSSFTIAKREDFIGEYLGSTTTKTKKLLNSCIGGVLFIDEAYALGPGQKDKDSFSKEAIDTLNVFLSEHKKDFCCIIAGYEEELQKCFFNVNKGLQRRFQWTHKIESYTPDELALMLLQKINNIKWKTTLQFEYIRDQIKQNIHLFKFMGGDIEKLITTLKMNHSIRVFSLDEKHRKIINKDDFDKSIKQLNKSNPKKVVPVSIQYLYS